MRGTLSNDDSCATYTNGTSDGTSAIDDGHWFSQAARALYVEKPGTILFLITGLGDERLCQKYASGKHRPPAYFLRALLRGEHGADWLAAVMHGCKSEWWREYQDAMKLKRAIDNR
jgi:hypothetical protein